MATNSSKALEHALLTQSENGIFHAGYNEELNFYSAVQNGDLEQVMKLYTSLDSAGKGILSKNSVRNYRYHLIVSIALITRFCIEGGMPTETAYTLSDLYIQRADEANSVAMLTDLHRDMIQDFTKRMARLKKEVIMSMPVTQAIDYIHTNIRMPITESQIAATLGLNPSYLSSTFKKEVGVGIKSYITATRIEVAKNMLQYSDYSYSVISSYLCFSSHSYFISVFKKYTGVTPKEYRANYFQSNWR